MEKDRFGIILPIILVSYFMILLDNSIVFTSTVKIANDLQLNSQTLAWITNAYALTFGGFLLLGGRAGDIFGRKRVFSVGMFIFSLGSLLVGLSQNGTMIITMRAFQGVGAAILAPTTLALLMDNYTGSMLTRAIAYYGATAGLGGSIGLILGGIIASFWSWRIGFLLNVPVGIILFILTQRFILTSTEQAGHLDWLGALASVAGFSALVYSISGRAYQLLALMLAIVFLTFFVIQEAHSKAPMMPLSIFNDPERVSSYVARFFYLGTMISYFFLAPQAMQHGYNYSPLMTAFGFMMETIPQFIAATLLVRMSNRFKNSHLLVLGVGVTTVGFIISCFFNLHQGYWLTFALPMIFIGAGNGLSLSPMTASGIAHTDVKIAGAASGVVNMVHQIGSSVGLSVIVALTSSYHLPATIFKHSIILMASFMVIAFLASVNVLRVDSKRSHLG